MIQVEAVGSDPTRGPWEAQRTFLGRWSVHWIRDEDVDVMINLPAGAYVRGCSGGTCSGHCGGAACAR